MVRGEYSEWVDGISGVPQGSVLGPILFLIYVNDIPEIVNCSIKMFADESYLELWNPLTIATFYKKI